MGIFNRNEGSGPQQGSGCSGRLITALIIAVVAWIMYVNQVETNPVTGEKQHVAISPDQEIKLGLESAPQMSKEMGGEVPTSDPRYKEVTRMGEELVNASIAKKSPWQFRFHLLADKDTVNAFALPGGQVFITLGLYSKLQNEAQLAGVLGHEMGHVIERHTAEQMAKNQLGQMLVVAVNSAASDYNQGGGSTSPAVIAAVVNQMFQLRYSRQDESEADVWGLKIMQDAGYDPYEMIKVMEILKSASGGGNGPEFFQTHPNPDLRIEQIKAYLQKNPPKGEMKKGGRLIDSHQTLPQKKERNFLDEIFNTQ